MHGVSRHVVISGEPLDELPRGQNLEWPERHQLACPLQIDARCGKKICDHAENTVLPIV
jgi:hypothetical protein